MVKMGTKKKSLSECFSDMINPVPSSFDPEDDIYPDTVAKVVENDYEFSDEETNRNALRKRNIDIIDGDERYDGAKVSRKTLRMQGSDTVDKLKLGKEECLESEDACTSGSDEESDDTPEAAYNKMNRNEMLQPRDNEDESIFQHISSRSLETEVERGIAVRNQLNLWDNLLECRIQLQKALTAGNKLPQYNIFEHFIAQGGSKFKAEIQQTKHTVTTLLEKLITLRTEMLKSYPETRNLCKTTKNECSASEVDEICSDMGEEEENDSSDASELQKQRELDRKHHNLEYYAELLSDHHKKYSEYRNATIQKWNDKTRVLVGKLSSRNFSNFEHSTLKQIEQILSNRQRLIQRSQLKRQSYIILGQELVPQQQQQESTEGAVTSINANNLKTDQEQCKEYYAEIYDDTDCYHQLLRELIERKSSDVTDPVQLGRQWLELQKLRSKMKRKIDTRATKGRKIRYVVHSKLVNFMAPVSPNLYTEEAKTELYNSLFGNSRG